MSTKRPFVFPVFGVKKKKRGGRKATPHDTKLRMTARHEEGKLVTEIARESAVSTLVKGKKGTPPTSTQSPIIAEGGGLIVEMENLLVSWMKDQVGREIGLSFPMIQVKARSIFTMLKECSDEPTHTKSFMASYRWFECFKRRHNVRVVNEGEGGGDDTTGGLCVVLSKPSSLALIPTRKRKRTVLTLRQKLDICQRLQEGEKRHKIMQEYGVGSSTLYDIKAQSQKLEKVFSERKGWRYLERRTFLGPRLNQLDEALSEWCRGRRDEGTALSGPLIIEKAKEIYKKMNVNTPFVFSRGWLARFKDRHGFGSTAAEWSPGDAAISAQDFYDTVTKLKQESINFFHLTDNDGEFLGFQTRHPGDEPHVKLEHKAEETLTQTDDRTPAATTKLEASCGQVSEEVVVRQGTDRVKVETVPWCEGLEACTKLITFLEQRSLLPPDEMMQVYLLTDKVMKEAEKAGRRGNTSTTPKTTFENAESMTTDARESTFDAPEIPASTSDNRKSTFIAPEKLNSSSSSSTASEVPPPPTTVPSGGASIHLHCPRDAKVHLHRHDDAAISLHLGLCLDRLV